MYFPWFRVLFCVRLPLSRNKGFSIELKYGVADVGGSSSINEIKLMFAVRRKEEPMKDALK